MAEILISLTIIGVIAAITLPALQADINEKTWAIQRKALYSRISQAISVLPSLNGYGIGATEQETASRATQTFINDGLSKVLKINNICDSANPEKCGMPNIIRNIDNKKKIYTSNMTTLLGYNSAFSVDYTQVNTNLHYSHPINTNAAAFETVNGESILVYYNPYCFSSETHAAGSYFINQSNYAQAYLCANFIYDLNGKKGPNQMGKDIGFMSAIYSTDSVLAAPLSTLKDGYKKHTEAFSYCTSIDKTTRLPNKEELMAIFYNKTLLNLGDQYSVYWASNYLGDRATYVNLFLGFINKSYPRNDYCYVRCIKR